MKDDRVAPNEGEPAPLVWIDMEMTGLHPESATILEIATLVTDAGLAVIATGPDLVVHQSDAILDGMDAWNRVHHGESGLVAASRASTIGIAEAEARTLDFLKPLTAPGTSPLCGNTIGQDRRFLHTYMRALEDFLHYRSVDVSTIKELARRWYPGLAPPEKKEAHRALDDILESIEELRFYRANVFR
jgi:oligoribonuclease